jgi:hypothetical protein
MRFTNSRVNSSWYLMTNMPHQRVETAFDAQALLSDLESYLARSAARYGTTQAINPPHRVKFHWPPHPVSYEYHVLTTDWTGATTFNAYEEQFEVEIAKTNFGVFGRCSAIWLEAKGDSEAEMLQNIRASAEPLFQRQRAIAQCLEIPGRFVSEIRELSPLGLLKLLYCEDRDVANAAHEFIERSKLRTSYFPALCQVLNDRTHPWRRSAQWCVLDLFEDLPSFIDSQEDEILATEAMKGLLWDAGDDYARTVYKAGVVMGGHLPHRYGGEALLQCLKAPSIVGRRSAIHGLFHVCEWVPEMEPRVVQSLRQHAKTESDPQLGIFSFAIADDIERGGTDHTPEPVFAFER